MWESFLATKESTKERLNNFIEEARRQDEDRAGLADLSRLPVPARIDLFEEVDADELISLHGGQRQV